MWVFLRHKASCICPSMCAVFVFVCAPCILICSWHMIIIFICKPVMSLFYQLELNLREMWALKNFICLKRVRNLSLKTSAKKLFSFFLFNYAPFFWRWNETTMFKDIKKYMRINLRFRPSFKKCSRIFFTFFNLFFFD